ncbi:MAG TPA: MgtC/SapB family protein [Vicinamibacterales bacterium]|nr:MgtC/SapB family protein [Vicinamibacterales bacterium]
MSFDLTALWNLTVAVLGGLGIGIEREWSGHAAGARAHFAGVRTFTLLALASGLAGWLWSAGAQGPALILLAGMGALIVAAYFAASRRDVDGTTEVAAFVVMAAGVLAGSGNNRVAAGIMAVTLLLLVEKSRLHSFVAKLDREEIRAAVRFAVMATVILPLLPEGPYGPFGGIRPRALWALVLLFSGLSFVGFAARRTFGRNRGYAIAGTLGGMISSTGATLTMAELSRKKPEIGRALASGALGANTVLFPRVLFSSLILAPALAQALWPACVVPALIGVALTMRGLRGAHAVERLEREKNPLQFKAAIQMTLFFQLVLFAVWFATSRLGTQGLYGSAVVLGLVEMDALTISMARLTASGTAAEITARAVTIGIISNTIVKLGIAIVVGRGRFRPLAAIGLALMALALGAALVWR